jgi:hypothetical protein
VSIDLRQLKADLLWASTVEKPTTDEVRAMRDLCRRCVLAIQELEKVPNTSRKAMHDVGAGLETLGRMLRESNHA